MNYRWKLISFQDTFEIMEKKNKNKLARKEKGNKNMEKIEECQGKYDEMGNMKKAFDGKEKDKMENEVQLYLAIMDP